MTRVGWLLALLPAGCLLKPPEDSGPPVGYWALLRDPDGHTLEISYGQELKLAVEHPA